MMPPSPGVKPAEQGDWSQTPEAGPAPNGLGGGQPPRPLTGIGSSGKMKLYVMQRKVAQAGTSPGQIREPRACPGTC